MCGRYAASRNPDQLIEEFEVEQDQTHDDAPGPDYNVAPTKPVAAIATPRSSGRRELRVLRWGLVPSWAKDPSIGNRMINARAETAASKPAFRKAMAARRCLLPADGFYEWLVPEGDQAARSASGRPMKQPYFVYPHDGAVLPMAGLYELWRDRTRPDDDPQAWWATCTVLTTSATDEFGRLHDRMPMAIRRQDWSAWLDPARSDAAALMTPAGDLGLAAHPVGLEVNNVRNNGPALIREIPADDVLPGASWRPGSSTDQGAGAAGRWQALGHAGE